MCTDKPRRKAGRQPPLRRSITHTLRECCRRTSLQKYEIQRVRREENTVEEEAINEWYALTPPTVTGNPPIQQNTGTAAVETLGKLLNLSCTGCPRPSTGRCSSKFGASDPSTSAGVVRYGIDPEHLSQTAKSPVRLNQNHASTVFRVRVDGLQPQTTYYYSVDSMQGNGRSDRVKSAVNHFTSP
jgi:hypothetical protein